MTSSWPQGAPTKVISKTLGFQAGLASSVASTPIPYCDPLVPWAFIEHLQLPGAVMDCIDQRDLGTLELITTWGV